MAPGIYHMSKLLDQMQGKTRATTILFYPGSIGLLHPGRCLGDGLLPLPSASLSGYFWA